IDKKRNRSAEGAFQAYTVLLAHMAAPIPGTLSYESAAVLPLGLSTAACGLFQKDHLALAYPSAAPKPMGKTLLVWGGSTSVGSNAIQLAVAAGYGVIATSAEACLDIVHGCQGDKFVSMASFPVSFQKFTVGSGIGFKLLLQIPKLLSFNLSRAVKSRTRGIRTNFIFGTTLMDNEVGRMIYIDFLPEALAECRYAAAPDPHIIGKGLEFIQAGFGVQRKGVSAQKVVVSL
ncbi:MAG TPA: hypothetical protein VGD78_00725, partial [Chthoniobacterales bacterium]